VVIILEDLVFFLFFICIVTVISDNLLDCCLLSLITLGYIDDVELLPTSTEICKQIIDRDISEFKLDILNRESGIQSFDAFLGFENRDNVVIILGLSRCWHISRWTIDYWGLDIGDVSYLNFIRKVSLPLILIVRFLILEIFKNLASCEDKIPVILTG
jgi:hypothetical protein